MIVSTLFAVCLGVTFGAETSENIIGVRNFEMSEKGQSRLLQTQSISSSISEDFDKLIANLNSVRRKIQLQPLSKNTTLSQIIKMWS